MPLARDDESLSWRVSWRPGEADPLTGEELVSDIKELYLGDGVVIVWPVLGPPGTCKHHLEELMLA